MVFDENGKWGTYNAPRFIKNGEVTAEPRLASEMVRNGYTFEWWYKDVACTEVFDFWKTLNENTTIYAKWTPVGEANYTVIIWKQNVAWDGYDFAESISLGGEPNTNVNTVSQQWSHNDAYAIVNGTDKKYTWFHLNHFDQNVEIAPEWNSVVNVYYDRNEITFNFYIFSNTEWYEVSNSTNKWYYYIPDWQWWYTRIYLYRYGNKWYKNRECNRFLGCRDDNQYKYSSKDEYVWEVYIKTSGSSWSLYESMVWLYGQTLEQNNYTWPTEYYWYNGHDNNGDTNGSRTTFLDTFMIPNWADSENFYGKKAQQGNSKVEFYKQKSDKSGYELANTVSTNANNPSFSISDKYNWFKADHYQVDDGAVVSLGEKNSDGYYDTKISYGNSTLKIYFNRAEFSINFMINKILVISWSKFVHHYFSFNFRINHFEF